MPTWDSTTWGAVAAAAVALLALAATVVLVLRLRRGPARAEALREEASRERAAADRARAELRWLRHLAEISPSAPLESVLRRALEAAAELADAAAAMIVLPQPGAEPLVATLGLAAGESARELVGFPPPGKGARATTLRYRYDEEAREQDELRLSGGIGVPVTDRSGGRSGTLAVFWRRAEREATDGELERLESLAAALGPSLGNALSVDRMRRELDIDPATGLRGRRSLQRALERECARARRYEHPLALLLLRLQGPVPEAALRDVASRLQETVRGPDVVCHLGEGRFAAVLPEARQGDAERLAQRLAAELAGRIEGGERARATFAAAGLEAADDAISLLARAEAALAAAVRGEGASGSPRTAVEPGA